MNTRTIRRDLEKLIKSEVPIQDRNEAHGRIVYWIDENQFKPAAFNVGEAAALYLGYRFLAPLADSFLGREAEEGLAKIRKQLSSNSIRCLDRLKEIFHQSQTGWSDYTGQSEIILTMITACEDRKETEILYRSYSAKEEQLYRIHPYALVMQQGTIYVLGFSCKRNEKGPNGIRAPIGFGNDFGNHVIGGQPTAIPKNVHDFPFGIGDFLNGHFEAPWTLLLRL